MADSDYRRPNQGRAQFAPPVDKGSSYQISASTQSDAYNASYQESGDATQGQSYGAASQYDQGVAPYSTTQQDWEPRVKIERVQIQQGQAQPGSAAQDWGQQGQAQPGSAAQGWGQQSQIQPSSAAQGWEQQGQAQQGGSQSGQVQQSAQQWGNQQG